MIIKNNPRYYSILMIILVSLFGCATVKNIYEAGSEGTRAIYRSVTPGKADVLKKRVLVVPIIDHAGLGTEMVNRLTDDLIDRLEKSGNLLVKKSEFEMSQDLRRRTPQFGIVVDLELAQKSAEIGMNALITSVLNPLEDRIKSKYFWPIKRVKREVEISMVVNVLNPINGTLYLTNLETRKKEIDADEFEIQERLWDIEPEVLQARLKQIIEDHASQIDRVLRNQPWTGKIVKVEERGVRINGGKDIGVRPGYVFEIFGEGEKLRAAGGRVLTLMGAKVGEIEVKEVGESYSLAMNLKGNSLEPGQLVRLKN